MSVYIKGRNDPEASGQISRTSPIMSRLPEAVQSWYKDSSTATWDVPFILVLLMFEAVICTAIIQLVPYTEIDWQAYMEQVTTFQGGQRNYLNIRGGTGPLVYPAGFLYMYSFFQKIAGGDGTDIDAAQNSFAVVYLLQAALILYLYTLVARQQATTMAKYFITQDPNLLVRYPFATAHCIWSWRMAMFFGCCLSKRIHSIFVLRLFNDGPAMVLLYISVVFFVKAYWKIGCVFFSLAVSIKMNILLFAPGLLLLLLQGQSNIYGTIVCLSICAGIQLFLGYPFLSTYPVAYLRKSFELDRVFMHKWTVNWKVSYNV
jgi:alpha-1,3-mannosyltransferase